MNTTNLVNTTLTQEGLCRGARATVKRALEISREHPEAIVAFGEFTLNPTVGLEEKKKREVLPNGIFFGRVISTIEDVQEPKDTLDSRRVLKKGGTCVFVTDWAHSPSVKKIGRRIWTGTSPHLSLYVDCVSTEDAIDPEEPMEALRDPRDWLAVNMFRELILIVPGGFTLLESSGVHQPSS